MGYRWNVDRIMRFVQIAIVVALLLLVLNYLSNVLLPFCFAFIVAYIADPLVNFLHKKNSFWSFYFLLNFNLLYVLFTKDIQSKK